jgi:hypothetical protein
VRNGNKGYLEFKVMQRLKIPSAGCFRFFAVMCGSQSVSESHFDIDEMRICCATFHPTATQYRYSTGYIIPVV